MRGLVLRILGGIDPLIGVTVWVILGKHPLLFTGLIKLELSPEKKLTTLPPPSIEKILSDTGDCHLLKHFCCYI